VKRSSCHLLLLFGVGGEGREKRGERGGRIKDGGQKSASVFFSLISVGLLKNKKEKKGKKSNLLLASLRQPLYKKEGGKGKKEEPRPHDRSFPYFFSTIWGGGVKKRKEKRRQEEGRLRKVRH